MRLRLGLQTSSPFGAVPRAEPPHICARLDNGQPGQSPLAGGEIRQEGCHSAHLRQQYLLAKHIVSRVLVVVFLTCNKHQVLKPVVGPVVVDVVDVFFWPQRATHVLLHHPAVLIYPVFVTPPGRGDFNFHILRIHTAAVFHQPTANRDLVLPLAFGRAASLAQPFVVAVAQTARSMFETAIGESANLHASIIPNSSLSY
jgi:hypothetical protein